jgi:hypothetical protein
MIIPVIIGVIGIVTKVIEKFLEAIPRKHSVDSIQKTSHVVVKVSHSETLSLNGGDRRWFNSSTREKSL